MIRCSQDAGLPGASAAVGGVHQKILSHESRSGSGRIFLTCTDLGGTRFNFSEGGTPSLSGSPTRAIRWPECDNFGKLPVHLASDAVSNVMFSPCLQALAFHVPSQQRVCTQTLTPPVTEAAIQMPCQNSISTMPGDRQGPVKPGCASPGS